MRDLNYFSFKMIELLKEYVGRDMLSVILDYCLCKEWIARNSRCLYEYRQTIDQCEDGCVYMKQKKFVFLLNSRQPSASDAPVRVYNFLNFKITNATVRNYWHSLIC